MADGLHLVIASGGTGGHFYPTLAVAREFMTACPDGRVTMLVSGKHAEEQADIAKQYGFESVTLPSVRLPGGIKSTIAFPFQMLTCYLKARKTLKALTPSVLLGMGSFAAVPACLAVNKKKTPLVLHEGNAFVGKTNRLFMGKASAIGLSLPLADNGQLRGCTSREVGMPLRDAIVKAAAGECAVPAGFLEGLGLSSTGKRTVLVFGGSQGARAVNTLITDACGKLGTRSGELQVIHLTGTDDNDEFIRAYREAGVAASVRKADQNIESCYLSADLVICRAGASSICELELFGKPAILIPLPTAADDHQTANARVLEAANAVCHFAQRTGSADSLATLLVDWLDNPGKWTQMGQKLKTMAKPDAAKDMVRLILDVLKTR